MSGSKILFTGCSFAYGQGLRQEINDPRLWCNQVASDMFSGSEMINRSRKGANNEHIFLETASALLRDRFDAVFVEWTAIPRFNINVGLELYETQTLLIDNQIDLNLNADTFKASWLGKLGDNLRMLHNDHWDILKLVKYVNVLKRIQPENLYFINGLLPWTDDYFTRKEIRLPSDLSTYEQELLSAENRDDEEVFKLYDMIHSQYDEYGGIQEENWINLYGSFFNAAIDPASDDDTHPGYRSQDMFAEMIKNGINS